jgi:regulator of protease activity HflC (stomatin/prohibitin superfamily)
MIDQLWRLIDFCLWLLHWAWGVLYSYAKQHPMMVALALLAFVRSFGTTVQTGWAGVLFTFGRATRVIEPGFQALFPIVQRVKQIPIRSVTLDLPKQRVSADDGLVYDVQTSIVYRIEDPIKAVTAIDDLKKGILCLVPLVVADLLREKGLRNRQSLDHELTLRTRVALERWGVSVETAGMSTIAPTRHTARVTQLAARVRERAQLLKEFDQGEHDAQWLVSLVTGTRGPIGRSAARYRARRPIKPVERKRVPMGLADALLRPEEVLKQQADEKKQPRQDTPGGAREHLTPRA